MGYGHGKVPRAWRKEERQYPWGREVNISLSWRVFSIIGTRRRRRNPSEPGNEAGSSKLQMNEGGKRYGSTAKMTLAQRVPRVWAIFNAERMGKDALCVVARKSDPWTRLSIGGTSRVCERRVGMIGTKGPAASAGLVACGTAGPVSLERFAQAVVDTAKLELEFRPSARGGDAR
ncbi:hypothetical protein SCHPADRAFT_892971 [Schizopora paradoxa]|uniref:Uncharacterized protein n=1 Tax=Schizopora paradoxa TaxID=27342 RepID=A0A0H2RDN0_9AGAM|nr:hypothetical protein SCHPADRAFT_892971 [Schizopora paradoxa]